MRYQSSAVGVRVGDGVGVGVTVGVTLGVVEGVGVGVGVIEGVGVIGVGVTEGVGVGVPTPLYAPILGKSHCVWPLKSSIVPTTSVPVLQHTLSLVIS